MMFSWLRKRTKKPLVGTLRIIPDISSDGQFVFAVHEYRTTEYVHDRITEWDLVKGAFRTQLEAEMYLIEYRRQQERKKKHLSIPPVYFKSTIEEEPDWPGQ